MKRNLFLKVITGCLLFLRAINAFADEVSSREALDFAEYKGKELLMTFQEPDLQKRYQKLDSLFLTHVDTDYISKFVAGRYFKQMSAEQKSKYRELFTRYGLAFYKTLPLEYAKDVEYSIKGAEKDGKFTNVAANVKIKVGQPQKQEVHEITLVFRLHKADGVIKAVDVKIAESSLLLSYRSKFTEMIAQSDGDIDWFLEDFTDLVYSLEQNSSTN